MSTKLGPLTLYRDAAQSHSDLDTAGNKMCTAVVRSILIRSIWADCSASQTTAHPVHGEHPISSTKLTRPGALSTRKLWSCSFSVLVNSFYLNLEVPLCWLFFFFQFSLSSHWEVERANNCVVLSCCRVKPQQVACRTVPFIHPLEIWSPKHGWEHSLGKDTFPLALWPILCAAAEPLLKSHETQAPFLPFA